MLDKTPEQYQKELTQYNTALTVFNRQVSGKFNMVCNRCSKAVHGTHVGYKHKQCSGRKVGESKKDAGTWRSFSPNEPTKPTEPTEIEK